jgi:hypothetical protein
MQIPTVSTNLNNTSDKALNQKIYKSSISSLLLLLNLSAAFYVCFAE